MEDIVQLLLALGGFEFVKWLFNRGSNKRIAQAEAENKELKNNVEEFHFLQERLVFMESEAMKKEQRFADQTEVVRGLNRQLLDMTLENGKLQAEIASLKAERAMKLCERRGCSQREPQSGY